MVEPDNCFDLDQGSRRLIFLGLTPSSVNSSVRFTSMRLAFLMYTAHNYIRHGVVGLNFAAGKEGHAMDWAARTLASAAHGHRDMGKELTERVCFGHNIVGKVVNGKRNKRKEVKHTPADGNNGRQRGITFFYASKWKY